VDSTSKKDHLTMKDVGNEVVMANGKPKPTKYGQWHSMYESRLWTSQPAQIHTVQLTHLRTASSVKRQHHTVIAIHVVQQLMTLNYWVYCPAHSRLL